MRNTIIAALSCLLIGLLIGFPAGCHWQKTRAAAAENEERIKAQRKVDEFDAEGSRRFIRSQEVSSDITKAINDSDIGSEMPDHVFVCMWREIRARRATVCRLQDPMHQPPASVQAP
jgi:hypothetical protein